MRTPLYDEHVKLGAKIAEFAGWDMPIYYSGINDEVAAVRTTAGIFDICHMGEFCVSGPSAMEMLQDVVTNDVSRIAVGQAQYNLLCDESGGVLDDLIIYRLDDDVYMPVVNASNTQQDFEWMKSHNSAGAYLVDKSAETGMIAIQGPAAISILRPITDADLSAMKRFHVKDGKISGIHALIASTGYTGSPGYELYCAAEDTQALWKIITEAGKEFGAKPAGLGARDVLRLEAGYPLYGNELDRSTTPLDASLMWAVKLDNNAFIGRDSILRAVEMGTSKKLVGLEAIEKCIPRHGYSVIADGQAIGVITSGTFSPTLQKGIAMAYVKPAYAEIGTELNVEIRGKSCATRVVRMPFYHAG